MEVETISPTFMKALIRCYLLQKQARKKVFHHGRFFKQIIKVFRWQRKIRRQVAKNIGTNDTSPRPPLLVHDSIALESPHSQASSSSGDTTNGLQNPPSGKSIQNTNAIRTSARREPVTDLDIVRRNLWLMIVRKDIVQAHRRKVTFKEQKLLKSRSIALKCQSHFKDFHRLNNKIKQE